MPSVHKERRLQFEFSDEWTVIKYDEHVDYTKGIHGLHETHAVDFIALLDSKTLYFIEVKDFRGHEPENRKRITSGALAIQVGQKVRDTIAGIVAAHHRGKGETWNKYVTPLLSSEPPVRIVLWIEYNSENSRSGRRPDYDTILTAALKTQLRWLTTKVQVMSLASRGPEGLVVSNLPRN